jgi:hypothetical protein
MEPTTSRPTSLVRRIKQRSTWDCGLACVAMIAKAKQRKQHHQADSDDTDAKFTMRELYHMVGSRSVWTIDLVELLAALCINMSFYTLSLEARSEYHAEVCGGGRCCWCLAGVLNRVSCACAAILQPTVRLYARAAARQPSISTSNQRTAPADHKAVCQA